MTFAVNIAQGGANNVSFRNRIINGGMVLDQRNNGASVTANDSIFGADRWKYTMVASSKGTTQQSTTAPTGFSSSLLFTSSAATSVGSTDYYWVDTRIEGNNLADMGFGTANASSFTVSFWVRSSLTGTFGGSFENSASNRSYPFSYTISAANTWEQKTVTVAGDTSGTWLTTNGVGLRVIFSLGVGSTRQGTANAWASADYQSPSGCVNVVGTSGATFYITGVQLEKGSTASPFEYRSFTTEVQLCQRYFCKSSSLNTIATNGGAYDALGMFSTGVVSAYSANVGYGQWLAFPVTMRIVPSTITIINTNLPASPTAGNFSIFSIGAGWVNGSPSFQSSTQNGFGFVVSGTWSAGAIMWYGAWTASAEL